MLAAKRENEKQKKREHGGLRRVHLKMEGCVRDVGTTTKRNAIPPDGEPQSTRVVHCVCIGIYESACRPQRNAKPCETRTAWGGGRLQICTATCPPIRLAVVTAPAARL